MQIHPSILVFSIQSRTDIILFVGKALWHNDNCASRTNGVNSDSQVQNVRNETFYEFYGTEKKSNLDK